MFSQWFTVLSKCRFQGHGDETQLVWHPPSLSASKKAGLAAYEDLLGKKACMDTHVVFRLADHHVCNGHAAQLLFFDAPECFA